MMNSEEPNNHDIVEPNKSNSVRRHRGATLMTNIIQLRAREETLQVEFTRNGEAIGRNGSWFRSYLGYLARSRISINIDKWKDVPDDVKNLIWDEVKTVFVGIDGRKEEEMRKARKFWKDFKSKLTNKFITIKKAKEGSDPHVTYPFLTPQIWEEFKASRETEEFKKKSDLQRKRQRGNLYPHTMSRGGYLKLEDKLKKKKLEERKTLNPMLNLSPSSIEIPCHVKWRQGRITKSGKFINNKAAIIAEKIDEYEKQSFKGEFIPSRRKDILTSALGTNERLGRVRGIRGNVGLKKFFGKLEKERQYLADEIDVLVKERVKIELLSMMSQMGFSPVEDKQQIPDKEELDPTDEFPCDALSNRTIDQDPFTKIPEEGLKCVLMLEDNGDRRAVAITIVLSRSKGDKLHGKSLPGDQMKVTILTPLDEEAMVAVPTDEIQIIVQAVGSFIAWPKSLIDFDIEVSLSCLPQEGYFKSFCLYMSINNSFWSRRHQENSVHRELLS